MFDLFHNISADLQIFLNAVSGNFWLTFWFIFAISIGEAIFVLGLFVPSTPVLLLAGGLIAEGRLPFWEVYFAAVLGAVIGDALSYLIGHFLKDTITEIWPFRDQRALIQRGEAFFARHGGKAVFVGRFIPGVKAVIPGVAGIMGMPSARFTIINVSSALLWAAAHLLPGLLLTAWLKSIGLSLELVIMVGSLILAALFVLLHFHRHILLFFAPWLGKFGRAIQARWGQNDTTG